MAGGTKTEGKAISTSLLSFRYIHKLKEMRRTKLKMLSVVANTEKWWRKRKKKRKKCTYTHIYIEAVNRQPTINNRRWTVNALTRTKRVKIIWFLNFVLHATDNLLFVSPPFTPHTMRCLLLAPTGSHPCQPLLVFFFALPLLRRVHISFDLAFIATFASR